MTISVSSGLGLLQMVSEPDIGLCARTLSSEGGECIVTSHIDWREERVPDSTLGPEGG